jgi:hypothetical protein
MTAYDYDKAPTDPTHGGKFTEEMARERIAELEAALRPFAEAYRKVWPQIAGGLAEMDDLTVLAGTCDMEHFARAAELVPEEKP